MRISFLELNGYIYVSVYLDKYTRNFNPKMYQGWMVGAYCILYTPQA